MAKPAFVPPAGSFVLPGMVQKPIVPNSSTSTSSSLTTSTQSSSKNNSPNPTPSNGENPPLPPARTTTALKQRNNAAGQSAPITAPSSSSALPQTSSSASNLTSRPTPQGVAGRARPTPPPKPGQGPPRPAPKLGSLAQPNFNNNTNLSHSRLHSRAFVSECPPLFLQAVECGRKARIRELEFDYQEARNLYQEAIEAFTTVTSPELQSTVGQKLEDYAEKVKSLDAKLALAAKKDDPSEEASIPTSASSESLQTLASAPSPAPPPSSDFTDPAPSDDASPVPESPFPAMNKVFHETFPELPVAEVLISYFSCSISDSNSSGLGKIFLTNNLICFAGSFDQQLKRTLKLKDIKSVEKKMLRIEVYTRTGEVTMFRGLVNGRSCYELIVQLVKSSNAVFGITLKELLMKEGRLEVGIPLAIESLIESLSLDDNLETEGIFRISASHSELEAFANDIDQGKANYVSSEVHVRAGALKLFFRKLPEPLLTFELYEYFLAILDKPNVGQQIEAARKVIAKLPQENKSLFLYLFKFLYTTSLHQQFNKMTAENLATVFGPTLLRSSDPDFDKLLKESMVVNDVMTLLLQQYCQIAAD